MTGLFLLFPCLPAGILYLITPASVVDLGQITDAVWFFPDGRKSGLFFFGFVFDRVCHGALSMCKHFCLDICWQAGLLVVVGVIIDSSEACTGVIAFAWQASV